VDLPCRPGMPVRKRLRMQPWGERMGVKCGMHHLPSLSHLGLPLYALRMGHMVLPINSWQQ